MFQRSGRVCLFMVFAAAACLGMSGQGCPTAATTFLTGPAPGSNLEGLWSLQRGQLVATFTWSAYGEGSAESTSASGQLVALDPADFPEDLRQLVSQWNAGLAALNAALDDAFPEQIVVTFPQYGKIRLTDPDDVSRTGLGAINSAYEYYLLGDLIGHVNSGEDQGAGSLLTAATISGSFDVDELTTTGQIARTLLVVQSGGGQGAQAFTAQISVDFTGQRTGDVPANIADLEQQGGFGPPRVIGD